MLFALSTLGAFFASSIICIKPFIKCKKDAEKSSFNLFIDLFVVFWFTFVSLSPSSLSLKLLTTLPLSLSLLLVLLPILLPILLPLAFPLILSSSLSLSLFTVVPFIGEVLFVFPELLGFIF